MMMFYNFQKIIEYFFILRKVGKELVVVLELFLAELKWLDTEESYWFHLIGTMLAAYA